jgi:hypothetical protein
MKIAVVISGLARFSEQGFSFLERITQQSEHNIDIFAGVWSIDTIPDHIASKLKGISYIPYDLRNKLHALLEDNFLSTKLFSFNCVTEQHAGLIGHMAACTAFKDQLVDYDLIIKWRWDLAMMSKDFELICSNHVLDPHSVITDDVAVSEGYLIMNEVAFAASSEIMLSTFTPVEEQFLLLGRELQMDVMKVGSKLRVGGLFSHAKLVTVMGFNVSTVPFKWALLRKNILDNLEYVDCQNILFLIDLQQRSDRIRNFELKKINSSTLRSDDGR